MQVFIGSICAFGFNYAPYGWALCMGQTLPIQQNAPLFSLIGTYYGGNGTTNFMLPNLQGRVAIDQGNNYQSTYTIGESGGSDTVTLTSANLPSHAHPVSMALNAFNGRGAGSASPVSGFPASSASAVNNFNSTASDGSAMKPPTIILGQAGGNYPVNISDPSLVMNYCICLSGIFPSRQ